MQKITTATAVPKDVTTSKLQEVAEGGRGRRVKKEDQGNFKTKVKHMFFFTVKLRFSRSDLED